MKKSLASILLAASAFVASASFTPAGAATFTGCSLADCSTLQAQVDFALSGANLVVTLSNIGSDVLVPADVLTAVFWSGTGALTSVSALLGAGSVVVFDSAPAGGVVGGEWAYGSGLDGPGLSTAGLSSAGFGLFGGATFPGADLDPPLSVNGMNYGLLSAADNNATGNAPVTGGEPFIQNAVVFTLSGTFDIASIANVWFQYGTALTEPSFPGCPGGGLCPGGTTPEIPLPAALPLLLGGLGGLAWLARRQKRNGLTAA